MREGTKVLIAEDNEMNLKILKIILDKNGFQYEIAQNGIEAISKYMSGIFNLILMDCQMPEMDGLQASQRIREFETKENKKRITILAMTANAMKGDREKCIESGMDDFIAKPFKSQDLLCILNKWIDQELK